MPTLFAEAEHVPAPVMYGYPGTSVVLSTLQNLPLLTAVGAGVHRVATANEASLVERLHVSNEEHPNHSCGSNLADSATPRVLYER